MFYQKGTAHEVVEEFRKYNLIDIIEKLSSLLLFFENIDKNLYFNYVIDEILCLGNEIYSSKKNTDISYAEFVRILKKIEKTSLSVMIDPMENIYYEKVMFYRNYYSFNGINIYPTYTLNNIITALFFTKNKINTQYKKHVSNLIQIVLRFQTEIIKNNFLSVNKNYNFTSSIFFPDTLFKMTTFDCCVIKKSLQENFNLLEDFIIDISNYNSDNINDHNLFPFFKKPIIKDDNDLIILDATMLTSALIDKIILLASDYNCLSDVESCIGTTLYFKNKLILDKMFYNEKQLKIATIEPKNTNHHYENIYYISNEEVVICFSEILPLNCYNNSSMFQMYFPKTNEVEKRINYYNNLFRKKGFKPLFVIVLNCINRGIQFAFNIDKELDMLMLNSYELKMIYVNEKQKPNFLLSYNKLKKHCQHMFDLNGEMKNIAYFACNRYSFYIDDEVDYRKISTHIGYEYIYDYISKEFNIDHKLIVRDILDDKNYIFKELENNVYASMYMQDRIARFYICNTKVDFYIRCNLAHALNVELKLDILSIIYFWLSKIDELDFISQRELYYIIVDFKNDSNDKDNYIEVSKCENDLLHILIYEDSLNVKFEILNNELEKKIISKIIKHILNFDEGSLDKLFSPSHKMKLTIKNIENDLYLVPKEKEYVYPSILEYELITEMIGNICSSMIKDGVTVKNQSKFLNVLIDKLFDMFSKEIERYDIEYLLKLAYNEYENVFSQMMLINREFKKRIVCYPEKQEEISSNYLNLNSASNALRFIIEYAAISQKCGQMKITLFELSKLIALANKITSYAEFSSYAKFKLIDINIRMLNSGRLGINIEEIEKYQNDFVEHVNYALEKDKVYKKNILKDIDLNLEINKIYSEEYGYNFTELLSIVDFINNYYRNFKEVICVNEQNLIDNLQANLQIEKEIILSIISDLSLFKSNELNNDVNKIVPWKYNKIISLYRKPFIKIEDRIIWGTRALSFVPHYIYNLILTGRFKTEYDKGSAKRFNGKILDEIGKDYTDFVYNKLNTNKELVCEKEKTVFNSKKMEDKDGQIGDIDVLCVYNDKKIIYFLECKCFRLAKNADEMRNFIDRMYGDDGHIKKVVKRIKWLEEHYEDVLREYNLSDSEKWTFKFAFIIDEPFILDYKGEYDIAILTSNDLTLESLETIS